MAKKKIDPEVRAVLEEIRRDVRELIAFIQSKLGQKPT
jgi:hypothetical protein